MKTKAFVLLLVLAMLCTVLTSCEIIELANNIFDLFDSDPDQTTNNFLFQIFLGNRPCKEHTVVKIDSVSAWCTIPGVTAGEICTKCNTVMLARVETPALGHDYDSEYDSECNRCGEKREVLCDHQSVEIIPAVAPTCSATGLSEGSKCAYCDEILVAQKKIDRIPHTEGEWIVTVAPTELEKGLAQMKCSVCQATLETREINAVDYSVDENASKGLSFSLNEDLNSYTLIDLGECTDSDIVIPTYYNGKPVTKIGSGAFAGRTEIVSIVIPEGVLSIGAAAFRACTSLIDVNIPSTVSKVAEYTFYGCYSLKEIELPDSLKGIGEAAFYMTGIETVVIPASVKYIGDYAFQIAEQAEDGAYVESSRLMSVTLYKGISKLGAYSFSKKTVIEYKGTANEWSDILINPMNYNYRVVCADITFIH